MARPTAASRAPISPLIMLNQPSILYYTIYLKHKHYSSEINAEWFSSIGEQYKIKLQSLKGRLPTRCDADGILIPHVVRISWPRCTQAMKNLLNPHTSKSKSFILLKVYEN